MRVKVLRRIALALAVVYATLLAAPMVASAAPTTSVTAVASMPVAPWDCKNPPTPAMPDTGLPGVLDPGPSPAPAKGDPWAQNPSTSIYDQYGYAGLSWSTYDLGCMGGLTDVDATIDTGLGNFFLSGATWMAAATNGIHNKVAHPSDYMGPLDRVVESVTQRLHNAIWSPWGGAALLGVAALLLYYSIGGRLSSVVSGAAWALLVLAVLSGVSAYPTRVAGFFDQTVTSTIGSVNQAGAGLTATAGSDSTRAQGALIVDQILYQAWVRGQLGDSESTAAKRWGPELFRESAFSRAEAAAAASSPEGMRKLVDQKNNDWSDTAQKIQDADPAAYATLQGKAQGRAGSGLLAFFGVLFTGMFRLIADLFVFTGLVMLRLLVMFFPAAAVFGVIAPMAAIVRRIGNIAGASIVNVIAFGAGSAAHTIFISGILSKASSDGMGILALVMCLVVTVAAFVLLLPLLSLTNILGRSSRGGHRMLGWARRVATDYVVGREAVEDGTKNADERDTGIEHPTRGRDGDEGPVRRVRRVDLPPETFARPPTPPWVVTEQQPLPDDQRAMPGGRVPADHELSSGPGPAGAATDPATTERAPSHRTRLGGIRQPLYDPAQAATGGEPLTGVLVDEIPSGAREVKPVRLHDSHTEVTADGVGTRIYDPATKQTILVKPESGGGRHE